MTTQLLVSHPSWTDTRVVQVQRLNCSWDVDAPGALTCDVAAEALRRQGISDAKGLWIRYEHGLAGRWAGVVTDQRANSDGSLSLAAMSLHWLLSAKRTAKNYVTGHAPAGSIAQRVLRDTATETTVWIDDIQADEDGALYSYESRGDDLLDTIDRFAQDANQEYDVTVADDGRISFEWRVRIGGDKTGSVLLREGAELSDVEVTESIATVVNDMLGVSDADEWPDAASAVAEDGDSIDQYGRRQATKTYLGADPDTIEAFAAADVTLLAQPVRSMRGTIAATHPVLARISHGDIVRVWLTGADYAGTLRVTNRALDDDSGTLTIAGELDVAA